MKKVLQHSLLLGFLIISGHAFAQSVPDAELKKNITPVSKSLEQLMKLQPQTFEYNTARFSHLQLQSGVHFGFTDKNMQSVFPQLVRPKHVSYMFGKNSYRNITYNTIDTHHLIPVLVASIQELNAEIEKLKAQINELKKTIP